MLFTNFALAATPLDPLIGVRVSLLASEHLLADPPLPSLEKKTNGALVLGGSLLLATTSGTGSAVDTTYSGSFSGEALNLGYKISGAKALGLFAYIAGTSMKGGSTLGNEAFTTTLSNFSTSAYVAMAGASVRVLGAANSPMALGLIFGPAAANISSSFKISNSGSTEVYDYSSNPNIFGAMVGAQISMRLGHIFLNPYTMYFKELTKKCKSYSTTNAADDGSGFDPACFAADGARKIGISASFFAFGANIGYDNFILNVYSQVKPDSSMNSITLNSFSLSYEF